MSNTVGILLAAGNAKRMGENKMMIRIGTKTVLERSLEAFEKAGCFDKVLIVCRKDDEADITAAASRILSMSFEAVMPEAKRGSTRLQMHLAAIEDADAVLVHDGARCFVKPQTIADCADAASKNGSGSCRRKNNRHNKTHKRR